MFQLDNQRTLYDNITFNIRTPSGTANIIIVEDSPGKIETIFFTIGKAGSDINAWAYALAESVTMILKTQSINDVLVLLSNITSSRSTYAPDGIACRSGPEALYIALMRYRNLYKDMNKKVTFDESYSRSKMRN